MTKVTLNADMVAKLSALDQPVELRDEAGALLGWYQPQVQLGPQPTREELLASCPISEEELDRRSANRETGRPLVDVLRDLEAL